MKIPDNLAYGLDFGTSNSAVSIINKNDQSEVLEIGSFGLKKIIRSVLFFPSNKVKVVYVGDEAISEYIKSEMRGRFMQSIKSILRLKNFPLTYVIGYGALDLEDIVSLILKNIKNKADAITGVDVKRVVLGRPAMFSEDSDIDSLAQKRLLNAAEKAGFEEVNFQIEPIAAALHYESVLKKEELVLVVDIGGGTSDFTIIKLSPDKISTIDRKNDILASNGVYIGGDNFDSEIMKSKLLDYFGRGSTYQTNGKNPFAFPNHILSKLYTWQEANYLKNKLIRQQLERVHYESNNPKVVENLQSLINNNLGYSLFCEIEKAKIALSDNKEAFIDFHKLNIEIHEKISKIEFEMLIREQIEKISYSIDDCIKKANITNSNIDTVFMTGGSSLIPSLKQIVVDKFGENKIKYFDSFTSVASGLALSTKFFV